MRAAASTLGAALLVAAAGCQPDPAPSDPIIAGIVDPISMPRTAEVQLDQVASAEGCKACHPTQYAEWSGSRHGTAMTDRVFQALIPIRQAARKGSEDRFCVQCHGVAGVRSGDVRPGFTFAGLAPVSLEGVSCTICHGASKVVRDHNAGLAFDGSGAGAGVMRGNLADPMQPPAHGCAEAPHLETSLFCASCHDVVELRGLSLERPYEEWLDAPSAKSNQTCQDCHMPRYDGKAALGGPDRTGLRSHRFVGFDPPGAVTATDPALRAAYAADVKALLGNAARVEIKPGPASAGSILDVVVSVGNRIEGHSLPTGTTFIRQTWLEIVATDDGGKQLYASGTLDANGDLRDRWSGLDPYGDPDLVAFSSSLLDAGGTPTLFPWEATEHHRNALRAGETRTLTYFVPLPEGARGTVHLAARLLMRPAPPFLLRLVKLDDLLPLDEPRELATATATATIQ